MWQGMQGQHGHFSHTCDIVSIVLVHGSTAGCSRHVKLSNWISTE
jgi:hypothetical protein